MGKTVWTAFYISLVAKAVQIQQIFLPKNPRKIVYSFKKFVEVQMEEIESKKTQKQTNKTHKRLTVAFVIGFTLDAPSKHLFPN